MPVLDIETDILLLTATTLSEGLLWISLLTNSAFRYNTHDQYAQLLSLKAKYSQMGKNNFAEIMFTIHAFSFNVKLAICRKVTY